MITVRKLIVPSLLVAVLILEGCAGMALKSPSVTLADIQVIEADLVNRFQSL